MYGTPMMSLPTPSSGSAGFDPTTRSKLDRWVAAKREKDFATADAIRSELRALGIEPDTVRPPDRDKDRAPHELHAQQVADPFIQAKLDRWVMAKREKDFGTADAIRAELHAVGLEPEQLRPSDRDAGLPANSSNLAGARFDYSTEARLDRWVQAKRDKDWALADTIRSELRALGIEPDVVRPLDRELQPGAPLDPVTEAKLDRWVLAKREKDFGTADAIRQELRAAGLEPDSLRPADRDAPSLSTNAARVHDAYTEAQLDQWVQAKRDKDFARADAIRAELRAQGIEPDLVRPSDRDMQLQQHSQLASQYAALQTGAFPAVAAPAGALPVPQPGAPGLPAELAQGWGGFLGAGAMDPQSQAAFSLASPALLGAAPLDQAALLGQVAAVDPMALFGQQSQPPLQASGSLISRVATRVYDAETEAQLDRWVAAKREKDFRGADAIRAELRAKGIEPDSVRPSDKDLREKGTLTQPQAPAPSTHTQWGSFAALNLSPGLQREIERQLDRWAEARRMGDMRTSESIARTLRSKGIDPEVARPLGSDFEDGPAAKRARGM